MTSAPAIGFEYRPSRLLQRLRGLLVVLAVVALLLSGMALSVRLLLGLLLIGILALMQRRQRATPTAVGWHPRSGWTVRMADGSDAPMSLRSFRVLAGCVVLNLAGEGGRHDLWLLPDNSDPDTRRRLRMRLAATGGQTP
jgi:toxin CptA